VKVHVEWVRSEFCDCTHRLSPEVSHSQIIPSSAFQTACTGDAAPLPANNSPAYTPTLAPSSTESPPTEAYSLEGRVAESPPPEESVAPAEEPTAEPSGGGGFTACKAIYETNGPWPQVKIQYIFCINRRLETAGKTALGVGL